MTFANIWTTTEIHEYVSYIYVVILSCNLISKHDHIPNVLSIYLQTNLLLKIIKLLCFPLTMQDTNTISVQHKPMYRSVPTFPVSMKLRNVIFWTKCEKDGKMAPLCQLILKRKCINIGLPIRTSLNVLLTHLFINLINLMRMPALYYTTSVLKETA
jgi:hypothetical protein